MKVAAVYARVSTKGQAEEGTSLDSQTAACLQQAEAEGYRVPEHLRLEEDWPDTTLDRLLLNQLRGLVRRHEVDALFCYSTDRLARNPIHLAIIAEDCEKYRECCHRVAQNLETLSFDEKRLALEALQVKVTVDKERLVLDGALPLSVASTPSGEGARG